VENSRQPKKIVEWTWADLSANTKTLQELAVARRIDTRTWPGGSLKQDLNKGSINKEQEQHNEKIKTTDFSLRQKDLDLKHRVHRPPPSFDY
jgi:hypothetical protein